MGWAMAKVHQVSNYRLTLRLMMAVGAAALTAGCADSSRFSDPFSDPYSGMKKTLASRPVDQSPTGTIQQDLPSRSAAVSPVESRPLPAPQQSASAPQSAPVSTSTAQPLQNMHVNNSGDPHWTASGGTPIVVAQGETASILANRYGVPVEAFIKSNGLSAQSQVQPGMRVVVPVYRASAVASKAPLDTASKPLSKAEMAALHQNELKAEKERKLLEQQALKQKELDKISARREALALEKEKRLAELKVKNTKGAVSKTVADNAGQSQTTLAKSPSETAPIAAPVVAEKATKSEQKLAQSEKSASDSSKNVDRSPTASIPPDDVKSLATDDGRPEFRWPARGRIIQGYASGGNDGINIAVPEGTQVKAAEGGEVAYAGSELKGYGNMVLIRHPNGFVTAYANNGELVVKKGDKVKRGQTIAHSGQSGNVGSPQLHFELRKGSTPVDPTSYLAGL